jgi:SSS family solute:Na+ symporter
MISFEIIDIIIILTFFTLLIVIGFIASRKTTSSTEDYLLSGRKIGLTLFVMITVSTWYGGIIGVGEFTYRYGLLSWVTQGFPYYFFALLFAIFFAKKIRQASLFTIPEKLTEVYNKKVGLLSAFIVFVLVLPAPYLLMSANLISLVFDTNILISLIISFILSGSYLIKGGFRSNVYADAFQFIVMFLGFILILVICVNSFGGNDYLNNNLPQSHLKLTGGASPLFLLIWFLIALWTFADPGFHQRAYAAKNGDVAKYGLIIAIIFFALFDFLTTSTGLYARALLPDLEYPVQAFPLLAEKVLSPGLKGIFYAALFATIISTLNSFLFLSATTISRDFIHKLLNPSEEKIKHYTIIGIISSGLLSIIIAYLIPSVIEIWYTIGSLFIPAIILPVIAAYYPKFKVDTKLVTIQVIGSLALAFLWFYLREFWKGSIIYEIEPMLVGLIFALCAQMIGLLFKSSSFFVKR